MKIKIEGGSVKTCDIEEVFQSLITHYGVNIVSANLYLNLEKNNKPYIIRDRAGKELEFIINSRNKSVRTQILDEHDPQKIGEII